PCGLDDVLPREERRVAGNRITEQPLVVANARRLVGPLLPFVDDRQFDRASGHPFAGPLGARTNRHHDFWPDAGSDEGANLRSRFIEDDLWWMAQFDDHFSGRRLERLAGSYVERHSFPSPRVDV